MSRIDKRTKKEIRGLFGKFAELPDNLDELVADKYETQSRLLVTLTKREGDLLSRDLYAGISDIPRLSGGWMIESLAPIPFLTSAGVGSQETSLPTLLEWAHAHCIRCVSVLSTVEYGAIGRGSLFAHGSVGKDVATLVRAALVLEPSLSWMCRRSALAAGVSVGEEVDVCGKTFCAVVRQ